MEITCGALMLYQSQLTDVAVESTFKWHWLVDGVQEQGFRAYLANTNAIK